MARFTGKRVLITGGTNGIGLAGARRIAAEGGQLVLTGTNTQRIAETQQALPHARVLSNDAGDPDDAQAVAQFGGLDGLWLNAGYGAVAGVDEVDAEFFDQMMNTNVRGGTNFVIWVAGMIDGLLPG